MSAVRCVVGLCENTPAKGIRFYRTTREGREWVCHKHYEKVPMEPEMRKLHESHEDFFLGRDPNE